MWTGCLSFVDQADTDCREAGLAMPLCSLCCGVSLQQCRCVAWDTKATWPPGTVSHSQQENNQQFCLLGFSEACSRQRGCTPWGTRGQALRGPCRCDVSSSRRGTTSPFSLGREAGASPTWDTGQEATDPGSELRPV